MLDTVAGDAPAAKLTKKASTRRGFDPGHPHPCRRASISSYLLLQAFRAHAGPALWIKAVKATRKVRAITFATCDVAEAVLSFYDVETNSCRATLKQIAERAGCARSTVCEAIKTLQMAGLLVAQRHSDEEDWEVRGKGAKRTVQAANSYAFDTPISGAVEHIAAVVAKARGHKAAKRAACAAKKKPGLVAGRNTHCESENRRDDSPGTDSQHTHGIAKDQAQGGEAIIGTPGSLSPPQAERPVPGTRAYEIAKARRVALAQAEDRARKALWRELEVQRIKHGRAWTPSG